MKKKSDGQEQTVKMTWWGYSDNEGSDYRFSVSIKEGDTLVGYAAYRDYCYINWTSSKKGWVQKNNYFRGLFPQRGGATPHS